MKALVLKKYGGNEALEIRNLPEPAMRSDEVLVEVHAAALNFVDIKIRNGNMRPMLNYDLPLVLGNDVAGKVLRVGARVTRFKPGDEVYGSVDKKRMGAFAEYAAVAETDLALKPRNLSFVEAVSLALNALTVHQALNGIAHAKPGQRVFIKAGSGGVGTLAIQYAKAIGLEVATTTSTGNVEWVRSLGADHVLDYKKEKFENVFRDFDIALDSVDNDNPARAVQILKRGGHLIALAGPPDAKFAREFGLNPLFQFVCYLLSFRETWISEWAGVNYSFLFIKPSGQQLAELGELFENNKIKPVIDRVFPFAEFRQAFEYLEAGRAKGKVVLSIR
jgi:NADPH:quinone reductase-like Zn-dependent oxidoreductase